MLRRVLLYPPGDVSAALASSARVLSGQVKAGSQRHFYMEPQVAVVTPEEGGRLHVVSSCQGCDYVSKLLRLDDFYTGCVQKSNGVQTRRVCIVPLCTTVLACVLAWG